VSTAAPLAPDTPGLLRRLWQLGTSRPVLSIADQGVVSAGNLLSVVIITRLCSRAEYGYYALAFTLVVAFAIAQQSLITEAYKVFVHRVDGEARRRYTGSTLLHQIAFAAAASTLLALVAGAGALTGALGGVATVMAPLAAVMALVLFKEYARQISFAHLQPALALALDSGVALVQVAVLAALAWTGNLSAATAVLALGVAAGLSALGWIAARWRAFQPVRAEALPDFRRNWVFGRWIFAYGILFTASVQSYPWILTTLHGPEATGTYGACFMVVNLLTNPLVIGLGSFLGPKTAQAFALGGVEALAPVVAKASLFFVLALGAFCAALFFVGGWILVLLSGEKYAGHGSVVFVLALAQLAWAYTVPANSALYAMERGEVGFRALLFALAVTLTAGVALVWAWGPMGAAAGLLAGNFAACVYTRIVLRRHLPRGGERSMVRA
jgi:O-antigen/teichoic acid export membrane protein